MTLSILIKPLVLLLLFALVVRPLAHAFARVYPEGRVKRLLLRRIART